MNLKKNIVANYIGQGWTAIMGLVFIPFYIKYLGIEAYGLIGIFSMLQTWFVLLDIGMSPALGREMARYTGGGHNARSIRDLLRSIEIFAAVVVCLITLCVHLSSNWLATEWLKPQQLAGSTVTNALIIMGYVCGLRFIENIYKSCIIGLQKQVLLNVLLAAIATIRGGGAVLVLLYYSSTILAFFFWQGIVSLCSVILFAIFLYRFMPDTEIPARFSWGALSRIWRFAGGMLLIMLLATMLTQTDKIILSRLLSLEDFGFYTLASTVAGVLYMLPGPISQALYPKFTEFITRNDRLSLVRTFHKGAQYISVFMGSIAMLIIFFGDVLLHIWTEDNDLVLNVAPILSVLALGTLFNGLMWLPGQMQLSHGFTRPGVFINCVAVMFLVPLLIWIVPRYGAIGAAWCWVMLNIAYLLIGAHFLFMKVLPLEKWKWYWQDVAFPILAAALIAVIFKWLFTVPTGKIEQAFSLIIAVLLIFIASVSVTTLVKKQISVSIRKAFYTVFNLSH